MYNEAFYPTPPAVAHKMLARLDSKALACARVLEPSAGKGDLADAYVRSLGAYGMERSRVHCIEIHPDLQAAIRGKGYTLVASDFLTYWPDEAYTLILMNPPFRDGVQHLLHAWEILPHGDVLCLLNEQTILNPMNGPRKQLAAIIEAHGEVEHLGACFESAERKTAVRVSLVHLRKEATQPHFDFPGMETEAAPIFDGDDPFASEIATRDMTNNLVLAYEHARNAFMDVASAVQVLAHYTGILSGNSTTTKALADAVSGLMDSGSLTCEAQEAAYTTFIRGLKKCAWDKVFELTKAESLMSETVKKEFDALRESQGRMAFSKPNIATLIETLFANRHAILRQCVLDAFDYLTEYHKENRLAAEGWKTNDSWRVNRKFILPYIVSFEWGNFSFTWSRRAKLDDIDRAVASLEGKRLEQVNVTTCKAIQELIHDKGKDAGGVWVQSDYFNICIYKKGTAHFTFRDAELWERFNIEAAKGKNWLADDYKAREKEARKRKPQKQPEQLSLTAGGAR